jgi:UDP-N-acetylglucosamine 1-carboxyvinyltransferase
MAEYIEITGGYPLNGSVQVSGAKNAALPMLMASLLTSEPVEFFNVPNLEDVNLTLHLLEHFGAQIEYTHGHAKVCVPQLAVTEASYSLVKALRASFWVLAPVLARGGAARVALPGGDIIGARPVDMHLAGLAQMGADLKVRHGVVYATAVQGLKPTRVELRFPSVGATHQIMMAASLTPGTSVIEGAAREPEVVALANLLSQMGAEIEGAGSSSIAIRGRRDLGGASVKLIGDRIEAGTYLLAAAASGGSVRAVGIDPTFFGSFLNVLSEIGLEVENGEEVVEVKRSGEIRAISAATDPFPGLATDLQAPLMAVLCQAKGISRVEENVFEGRFGHVSELCRMGANITVDDRLATITGIPHLTGAPVEGLDIRASAALVIAALSAEGLSMIYEPQHLRRGYEALEAKLSGLGAQIGRKVSDAEDYFFAGC